MKSWLQLAVGFFVLTLVLVAFIFMFAPNYFRQPLRSSGEREAAEESAKVETESDRRPASDEDDSEDD